MMRDQRALGFDRRVILLNCEIRWDHGWPTPHLVSTVVRSVVHPLKEAAWALFVGAKSLVRRPGRSRTDVEADTEGEKSTAEIAMVEYRRKLRHTFGSSGRIDFVVRDWTNGE